MKKMSIILPEYFSKEHNDAMSDLVERIAEDYIEEESNGENEWKNYTVEVSEPVARIFTALSNADCLYVAEV